MALGSGGAGRSFLTTEGGAPALGLAVRAVQTVVVERGSLRAQTGQESEAEQAGVRAVKECIPIKVGAVSFGVNSRMGEGMLQISSPFGTWFRA